jgi:outer membrane protein OmpA-like peptidoglycan-associated protein
MTAASGSVAVATRAEEVSPAPAAVEEAPAAERLPWDLTHRAFNTWDGSTGGLFVDDPGMAEVGSLRLQLAIDRYSGDGFLYDGDSVEQDRQQLSMSWTALPILEVFASLLDRATSSDTPAYNSLHAFGDVTVGLKVGTTIGQFARVGGSLRLLTLGDVSEHGSVLDATSMGARASGALDLQKLDDPLPLVLRLNIDYLLDNSGKALDDIEALRYDALADPADPTDETRHLITRVERFGLAVNRVDTLTAGIGVEAPLALTDDLFIYPTAELRLGLPLNRQDFNCAYRSRDKTRGTNKAGADDTCLDDAGFEAWPMNVTVGVRVAPPIRGVTALLGFDLAIQGASTFVRELQPQAPYRLLIALGYDYDARPPAAPKAAPAPPPPPPAPALGHVAGKVVDQMTNAPISGVVVSEPGQAPVATDSLGRFTSYDLSPGDVTFDLSHPDYQSARCTAVIPSAGGVVEASCSLAALPASGALKLTVRDQYGAAVSGAHVLVVGVSTQSGTTDASGDVLLEGLGAGEYTARIESDAYLMRVVRLSVARRQQTNMEASLTARPGKSGLTRKGTDIKLAALKFQGDTVDMGPAAQLAVAELADLLLRDPTIRRVRIQADGGESLALGRALAVKQRLVDAGVPDTRLEAATEPASKPTITVVE